jgi:hypothetical protein
MLMLRFGLAVVVGMLLGAGIVVSRVQMKRGMGVAAGERERQQQDDAAREQGPLHGTITDLRKVGQNRNPA